jgi:hypothetical protein
MGKRLGVIDLGKTGDERSPSLEINYEEHEEKSP